VRIRELRREQLVSRPPGVVFAFFADARNLERITPAFVHFRILAVSTPTLALGTTIDYRLRLHGVPIRWRSAITCWEPGRRFVDEQVRGPYALWQHTHEFEPCPGGTLVRDVARYALPLGRLGELVAGAMVRRDLDRIFAHRHEAVAAIFP
jgi:ligand-binding SRPBCC domain-containing protein